MSLLKELLVHNEVFSLNFERLNRFFDEMTKNGLKAGEKYEKSLNYNELMEPWRIAQKYSQYVEDIVETIGVSTFSWAYLKFLSDDKFKLDQTSLNTNWVFLRYMLLKEKKPTTLFFHEYLTPPSKIKFNDLSSIKNWATEWASKFLTKLDLLKEMIISEIGLFTDEPATELLIIGSESCLARIMIKIIKPYKGTGKKPEVFLINSLDLLKDGEKKSINNYFKKTFGWETLEVVESKNILRILTKCRKPIVLIPSRFWFSKGIMTRKRTLEIVRFLWKKREEMRNKDFPGSIKFVAVIGGFKHYVKSFPNDLAENSVCSHIKNSEKFDLLPFKYIDTILVN